jgi:hypothetical protein
MSNPRSSGVPADDTGSDPGWKALWVVRELALPAIVKPCLSCRSTRHRLTGKFRVNANGKLLDVWLLIRCEQCQRTSKIPVHERTPVQALGRERLQRFERNDPALVRDLVLDERLARRTACQLDWNGTWTLETDLPFYVIGRADPAPITVIVRFELPAPVRVEKLLMTGFGLSRSAVRALVESGFIRLPVLLALDAKARDDFTFVVAATPR